MFDKLKKNKQVIFPISTIIGLAIGRLAGIFDTIFDNPYPVILFDVEMHHFYYGLFLLCIFLPFFVMLEKKKSIVFFMGFGFGVMLDDLVLIMKLPNISYDKINEIYMETWPYTLLFLLIFSAFLIYCIYKNDLIK